MLTFNGYVRRSEMMEPTEPAAASIIASLMGTTDFQ
jgi:hypothetical protein